MVKQLVFFIDTENLQEVIFNSLENITHIKFLNQKNERFPQIKSLHPNHFFRYH